MAPRVAVSALAALSVLAVAPVVSAQVTGKKLDHVPVPYVDRPLTLPALTMAGELDATFTHVELELFGGSEAFNSGAVEILGSFGLFDDLELEAAIVSFVTEELEFMPTTPEVVQSMRGADWGVARFGATFRFFADDYADIGARFRLLIDNNATVAFNPSLPIRVRYPGVFRLDTGVSVIGMIQTQIVRDRFAIIDANSAPMGPDAGVPVKLAFNLVEQVYLGLSSGFGVLDVSDDDSIFFPLGAQLGGTLPLEGNHVLDLAGLFNFPLFFIPSGNNIEQRIGTEIWQVGAQAKIYLELPK